ncbi:plasminogen activator inhibitor 1-like isoform X2 [Paramacrobiotus metropolitanus]|uniref:plasminogen activator inhibitor 1-like isoform X2 n=1 Tax=Paramacrobiotus metropolitanus TaxID=2943436 RepID=UPI002445A607|nr:plasminogen activator inhibitor 1-like isoform X2 [Paramacrobiotus metropolitanus]
MGSVLGNPLTSLVLLSLLTFSAPWVLQFEDNYTKPRVFTALDGSQKTVPFLLSGRTTWTSFNAAMKTAATDPQMVIMEAGEKRYSVMCVLPATAGGEGLRQLEESLSAETLRGWRKQSVRAVMALSLPKFRITCQVELRRGIEALGRPEVDELGVRSSVATVFSAEYLCVPIPAFIANRPFLLLVWHNQLDIPLFIGRITDPTQAS